MSDSRPGDHPPVDEGPAVPPPPQAPPGAGANDPWAPGQPQQRPPDGYGAASGPHGPHPGGYADGTPPPRNGAGTSSLVLGIVGLVFAVLFFPLGFVLAVIGLVLGLVGLNRAKRGMATNRGVAVAGTALAILALVVCIGWGVVIGVLVNKTQDCNDPDLSRSEQRQCVEDKLGEFTS